MGQMRRTLRSILNYRLLFLLVLFSISTHAQNWSTFLDSTRAITWTPGTTIPNYTVACSTQPTLLTGSSNDSANAATITNALNSCDSTHNVVNLPAGTYYVTGWTYPSHGHQVVRGAGANSTYIYITGGTSCNGWSIGICIGADTGVYFGSSAVLAGGSHQCAWTAGYAQGTTTITLSSCGSAPPSNALLVLDQANDSSDTGGIYICDSATTGCTGEGSTNHDGRIISGVTYSQAQTVFASSVVNAGGGNYTVTITPGVYFNNIRSSQTPGAWWPGFAQNNGLETLTIDQSNTNSNPISIFNCYQCWVKGIRSLYGGRNDIVTYENLQSVIRDSYFYGAQTPGTSQSYGVEFETATSALLLENNIFQQTTNPIMFGQGTGNVIGYNFAVDNQNNGGVMALVYYAHNAGSEMNLWEGNNLNNIHSDSSTWGSSTNGTIFRNMLTGWQLGKTYSTLLVSLESWSRAFNVVGNILGEPGYQTTYESYATSATGGINIGDNIADTSIYALGWTGYNGTGGCGTGSTGGPPCGPLVRSTLMRWGNWDVVTNGTKWDSTEASPAAVPYVNANFTASYFNSLAHTLPASLYYNSTPSWWPSGKAWPPTGPDVSSGNLGVCTGGTYPGTQTTSSSLCGILTGAGTLTNAWASHANSIPAQDCYLNVMHGPVDGSGSVLSFDASQCYASSGSGTGGGGGTAPAAPTALKATVS